MQTLRDTGMYYFFDVETWIKALEMIEEEELRLNCLHQLQRTSHEVGWTFFFIELQVFDRRFIDLRKCVRRYATYAVIEASCYQKKDKPKKKSNFLLLFDTQRSN